MAFCSVKGCNSTAVNVVELRPDLGIRLETAMCKFHATAMAEGETWAFADDDQREIVLGSDGPLEVISYRGHSNISGKTVELILGHDGVEAQRITVRMEARTAKSICWWVAGSHHPEIFAE